MKPLVIYHSADFDGLFSHAIAHRYFRHEADYLGWDYGQPAPAVEPSQQLFMIDISVDSLMSHPGLVWIDHHKSAIDKYDPRTLGYRIDGVAACRLAWQYFSGTFPLPDKQDYIDRKVHEPRAVRLAGEYDIWDKRDPDCDLFQSALRSQELTPLDWDQLLNMHHVGDEIVDRLLVQGKAVEYASAQSSAALMRDCAFDLQWEGLNFLALNKPRGNSRTFAAGVNPQHDALLTFYWLRNKWRMSLYHAPHRTDLDLSQIAVKYGGGGHRGACGFESASLPFTLPA